MPIYKVDDCSECPLYEDLCSGGYSPYGEPPCTSMKDGQSFEELYDEVSSATRRREAWEDKKFREAEEKKKKEAITKKLREESKWRVYPETREIKLLRKRISGMNASFHFAKSLAEAFNFANEAFKYPERKTVENPYTEDIAKCEARITELEALKKKKLKELREERKHRGS